METARRFAVRYLWIVRGGIDCVSGIFTYGSRLTQFMDCDKIAFKKGGKDMYCNDCGYKNPDNSNFCSGCGQSLNSGSRENVAKNGNEKFTLTLFRESQMFIVNPPMNIEISGKVYGSIANGERIDIQLQEGEYEVSFLASMRKTSTTVKLYQDTMIAIKWNRASGKIETCLK